MVVAKSHEVLLNQLRRQVKSLQKKEAESRKKLNLALKNMRMQEKTHQVKLADIEKKLLHSIELKGKTLATAIATIEKQRLKRRMGK